jgi:hypothetical protein
MKTVTSKAMRVGRTTAVVSAGLLLAALSRWCPGWRASLAAIALACLLLALAGTERQAEATFPSSNGKIAFASDRTTGEGVDNPEGDFEIFTMNRDGTGLTQLTDDPAGDFTPDWQPPE